MTGREALELDTILFHCPACATGITGRHEILPHEPGIYECGHCRWAGTPEDGDDDV